MKIKLTKDRDYLVGENYYYFNDSTMSRILEHAQNGMFIISAMRGGFPIGKSFDEFTPAEKEKYLADKKLTKQLENDIKAAGLGYIPSVGGYNEDAENGETVDVNEFSFIVPRGNNKMSNEEFVKFAVSLAKKYDQDSVLIAGIPEIANGQIRYVSPSEVVDIDWDANQEADFTNTKVYRNLNTKERPYYTAPRKMGGRNFVFDSVSQRNMSHVVGIHHVFGQHGWLMARKNNEIVIRKVPHEN